MSDRRIVYPALDRANFLAEQTCVSGGYIPSYYAEAAQILAEIDLRLSQQPGGDKEDVPG